MRIWFFVVAMASLLISCADYALIERNESVLMNKTKSLKIICIDPQFYYDDATLNFKHEKRQKIINIIKKNIITSSKKNGIMLELYTQETGEKAGYYEKLLPVKNAILRANSNQLTSLNFNNNPEMNSIQKKVFIYPPKIYPEFSSLKNIYGTPYFSYLGIYADGGSLILYHVVVDTDLCETVYREYKKVKSGIQENAIAQMIFDSYVNLTLELKAP